MTVDSDSKSKKILAVDDEVDYLKLYEDIFKPDFDVIRTETPDEALTALRTHSDIGAVLLDYSIGYLSGLDLLAQMLEMVPGLRVFVITGHHMASQPELESSFIRLGIEKIIYKPFHIQDLMKDVLDVLGDKDTPVSTR